MGAPFLEWSIERASASPSQAVRGVGRDARVIYVHRKRFEEGPRASRTRDGAQVDGKLTQVTNDGVEIQALTNGNIEDRKLAFGDISSLKTGQRKSGFAAALNPVLTMASDARKTEWHPQDNARAVYCGHVLPSGSTEVRFSLLRGPRMSSPLASTF